MSPRLPMIQVFTRPTKLSPPLLSHRTVPVVLVWLLELQYHLVTESCLETCATARFLRVCGTAQQVTSRRRSLRDCAFSDRDHFAINSVLTTSTRFSSVCRQPRVSLVKVVAVTRIRHIEGKNLEVNCSSTATIRRQSTFGLLVGDQTQTSV